MVKQDLFRIGTGQRRVVFMLLVFMAILWLLPLYSLVINSLKVGGLGNYSYVLTHEVNNVPFPMYFANSAIISLGSATLVSLIGALSGFAFSKIRFRGSRLVFNLVAMCLAVSAPIVYVPFFFILKSIHLYDTYLAVILPETVMTLPFAVLMIKNYFDATPAELKESAIIDGAGDWQIFSNIFLPLAKPVLINLGVLQIMWSFQDFFMPLMFLTNKWLFTATIAINVFKGVFGVVADDLGHMNAALVLIGLPAVVIFVIAEKYIVSGVTSGALKE